LFTNSRSPQSRNPFRGSAVTPTSTGRTGGSTSASQ